MNILFLTLYPFYDNKQTGIYPDLIGEFVDKGHDVYVVSPCEKKNVNRYKARRDYGKLHLLSALIPDYFGVGLLKKGISSLVLSSAYIKAINMSAADVSFQMVLYSTPPITFSSVIDKIKKRDNAFTYLLLKDIWPQGPIDIGALTTTGLKGIVTRYFRQKERKLYSISDYIGCMSGNNCRYLIDKSGIDESKVEICPNSVKLRETIVIDKESVRRKNGLPIDKTIFVYGGNLGVAQGIDFLITCLAENEKKEDTFILIIGSGTEFPRISRWFEENRPKNSKLMTALPHEEYIELMAACDVGLIFLDHRFTIPNFPSRLLSYMEGKMPVLAATDTSTDIGQVVEAGKFGYWCESNDVQAFVDLMDRFSDKSERELMGSNAFNYLKAHYDVAQAYETIIAHIDFRGGRNCENTNS